METKKVTTVQSVDRALVIIEVLQAHPRGLGVTELANHLDVAKSTIHRLLMSLMQKGFVKREEDSEKYVLGLKLIELGETVSDRLDIRKIASPILQKLAEVTGETVHLVIMDHLEVVYIDKTESAATIRMFSRVGKRAPMHCTGVGKAILAYLPEDKLDQVLDEKPMKKFTETTITNKQEMREHLKLIRKRGYSIDNEEHEEGIKCAASPIFDHNGNVVAGLSVAGPIMRIDEKKMETFIQATLEASKEISGLLGG